MQSLRFKNSIQTLSFLHNFNRLHLYSTKSPNQSFANYLVNSLGFSDEQALSTSTKVRFKNTNDFKSSDNADSVIDFLKRHGFDDTHLKRLVSCYPRILSSNVEKTLIPRFKLLQDHGFSGSNLITLVSLTPSFAARQMDHVIRVLRPILGSNDNLLKFFNRVQFRMTTSDLGNLNSNIALLNIEYGLDFGVIRNSILVQPRPYLKDTELFRNILVRVEEELGIPRNSGRFLYGMYLLCSSKKKIELKSQLLKSFGWTEYDVSELLRRNPHVFFLSEENIKKKLGYLMTELGYKPDFLVTNAVLFNYSLEKRMEPRRRVLMVLKEKGLLLDYNFYSAIGKTETQFLKRLIEPFKEDVPGLLELYQSNKGCSDIDSISR